MSANEGGGRTPAFGPDDTWWVHCKYADNIARMHTKCKLWGDECCYTGISAPKHCGDYEPRTERSEDDRRDNNSTRKG
jgi:hypothetical protein